MFCCPLQEGLQKPEARPCSTPDDTAEYQEGHGNIEEAEDGKLSDSTLGARRKIMARVEAKERHEVSVVNTKGKRVKCLNVVCLPNAADIVSARTIYIRLSNSTVFRIYFYYSFSKLISLRQQYANT